MPRPTTLALLRLTLLGFGLQAATASLLSAQINPPGQVGLPISGSREAMWPAPTTADWSSPCLIYWQRSFDDAVHVARESGKPILICVNMDGEIASEHYAGIRYRRAETAVLYEPYVTVIASVYRHTPRDFDEAGRRVLCPRFGSVTCGEHIAIEPGLFDGFFEGQRVAPRHVMVELEESGSYSESYDIFYAFDTDSVFQAIRSGIENRPAPPVLPDLERDQFELVSSRDNADRTRLEQSYLDGNIFLRRRLLESLANKNQPEQIGLLRLALYDLDVDLVKLARLRLAEAQTADSIDLITKALRVPTSEEEREALVGALERIGQSSERARTLAAVHRGLVATSEAVDVASWTATINGSPVEGVRNGLSLADPKLEYKAQASRASPEDPTSKLDLAEAYLSFAVDPDSTGRLAPRTGDADKYKRLLYEDALRAAKSAADLGSSSWRVLAIRALASTYLGRRQIGYQSAQLAVEVMPPGADGWMAMATMALFAESRQRQISKAERGRENWPSKWLTDVNAAYSVLAQSPYGTAAQSAAHYDFLWRLGARDQAELILDNGIGRFPSSWELHARLRAVAFERGGLKALEAAYKQRLARLDAAHELVWYAGYASLVAAEFHRRAAEPEAALAAYSRGIEYFERTQSGGKGSVIRGADHYIAMAHAGRSRMALESEDFETARREILASFNRHADAAGTLDGLGLTPVSTAQMIIARLVSANRQEEAAIVQAALDSLDPKLLVLPAFEKVGDQGGRAAGVRSPGSRR